MLTPLPHPASISVHNVTKSLGSNIDIYLNEKILKGEFIEFDEILKKDRKQPEIVGFKMQNEGGCTCKQNNRKK